MIFPTLLALYFLKIVITSYVSAKNMAIYFCLNNIQHGPIIVKIFYWALY